MFSRVIFAASAALFLATAALAQQAAQPSPDDRARQWLSLVDNGNYSQAWTDAAPGFRDKQNGTGWTARVSGERTPLGAMVSRDLDSVKLSAGESTATVHYVTSFTNRARASETVVLAHAPQGGWAVAGYQLR